MLRQSMRGLLPQEILKRKKFSLSVLADQWVCEEISNFAVDLLSKKRLRETGYFNSAFMNQMLNRHRKGEENFERLPWGCLESNFGTIPSPITSGPPEKNSA